MESKFKECVYGIVKQIPLGRVMTYGQIAVLCNQFGAARVVGQIAHFGPSNLPWHRVVHASGLMARGFVPEGRSGQEKLLRLEGIEFNNGRIEIAKYLWSPKK